MSSVQAPAVTVEGGALRSVEMGATFLTGVEVDVATSLLDPTDEGPGGRLARSSTVPMRSSHAAAQTGGGLFYAVSGSEHGTEVVPRTLATVDPGWLLDQADPSASPEGWTLRSVECDVHDYGVGMLVLRWEPHVDAAVAVPALDAVLAALTTASTVAVAELAPLVAHACADALHDDPARLDLSHGLDLESVAVLPPVGEVLWLWHVLTLTGADHPALARSVAAVVCPNDAEVLELRDHTLAAGVHASVVCSTPERWADGDFLARAPRRQDSWWTLFWRLDRVLLALQLRLEANLETQALAELQTRAEVLHDVSTRVSLLRSRLDSLNVASGARDLRAWHALAAAWDLPYRIAAVDQKLTVLTRAYAEVLSQISNGRAARVNFMIYVFTAFSLVASVVAVAQFAQGSADTGAVVRLVTIVGSVLGALFAVLLSVRTTRAIRRRREPAS
ncbi:hypothetical protein G5V58_20315 [Nocardioides anomalus]|uniref:Uncharacterized protein n=1 Tax=Nocardioides anomalus TaxID=2712223 RepID=A0A6G6WHW6_9ACTN|nr:hypothetical protein [Nocardioides anomalus]QIG44809.1 hypothetical protein G5V58_20315 [Nocardioides anomalus]